MEDVQVKSNICKIFHRQDDGKKVVFGCGCLVKCGETLKVATSSKIRDLTGGEVFALFSTMQEREIKLRIDTERKEKEGIAYNSLDETAFEHRPEGISIANYGERDRVACCVPVLEKMDHFQVSAPKLEFYNVVKNQSENKCTLEQVESKRVIDSLRQSDRYHSLVLGAPILDDKFEFLGIVDFLKVGDDSWLELVCHDIQRTTIAKSRPLAGLHEEPQETVQVLPAARPPLSKTTDSSSRQNQPSSDNFDGTPPTSTSLPTYSSSRQRSQLSLADPLRDLWENNIEFCGTFSGVLDVKYSNVRSWPHLAEQFGIDKLTYEKFSTSDISSPSEGLLDYLETKEPDWNIEELCKSLKEADANDVCRIVEQKIKAGELKNEDLVSELCDNAPSLLNKIVLKLDREERLWQNLARQRRIPRKTYLSFKSNGCDNRARVLFDRLQTEAPDLSVVDFKEKLKKLGQENVLKTLRTFGIEDNMLLKDLSKYPEAKTKIETTLNNNYLWELAKLYQKDGLLQDIDIETVFRPQQDVNSPTCKLMKHVLASHHREPTIEDLVLKLKEIRRKDCVYIIEPYLTESGREKVQKILGEQRLENIQKEKSNGGKQPSTGDEERVSVPASDQPGNNYVQVHCQASEAP